MTTVAAAIYVRQPGQGENWQRLNPHFTLCGEGGSPACVIDGDTIVIAGGTPKRRKIRMVGYNAPEIHGACDKEVQLARQSRNALRDWLNAGAFSMTGGNEPAYDKYGRELREFRRGQEWLADYMIENRLAQNSGWGFVRGGWCE